MMTDAELNEAVARKLGWIRWSEHPEGKKEAESGYWFHPDCGILELPDYVGSIEAAWEIVDGITKNKDDWWCALRYKPLIEKENGGKWNFSIVDGKTNDQVEAIADTAPLAIALVFLKLL